MNWMLIVLVLLAIVGSMMWMMPSPRQRVQALLRQQAMRQGFQVQIARILFPRALGEMVADQRDCVAYRLPRLGEQVVKPSEPWQIFKVSSHANSGLPDNWSWKQGEGRLAEPALELINQLIEQLPTDVYGIESTPISVSLYWQERGTPETVTELKSQLQQLIDAGV